MLFLNLKYILNAYAIYYQPILTPYELEVMVGSKAWEERYPMDYYSSSGGPWSNLYHRINSNVAKWELDSAISWLDKNIGLGILLCSK